MSTIQHKDVNQICSTAVINMYSTHEPIYSAHISSWFSPSLEFSLLCIFIAQSSSPGQPIDQEPSSQLGFGVCKDISNLWAFLCFFLKVFLPTCKWARTRSLGIPRAHKKCVFEHFCRLGYFLLERIILVPPKWSNAKLSSKIPKSTPRKGMSKRVPNSRLDYFFSWEVSFLFSFDPQMRNLPPPLERACISLLSHRKGFRGISRAPAGKLSMLSGSNFLSGKSASSWSCIFFSSSAYMHTSCWKTEHSTHYYSLKRTNFSRWVRLSSQGWRALESVREACRRHVWCCMQNTKWHELWAFLKIIPEMESCW